MDRRSCKLVLTLSATSSATTQELREKNIPPIFVSRDCLQRLYLEAISHATGCSTERIQIPAGVEFTEKGSIVLNTEILDPSPARHESGLGAKKIVEALDQQINDSLAPWTDTEFFKNCRTSFLRVDCVISIDGAHSDSEDENPKTNLFFFSLVGHVLGMGHMNDERDEVMSSSSEKDMPTVGDHEGHEQVPVPVPTDKREEAKAVDEAAAPEIAESESMGRVQSEDVGRADDDVARSDSQRDGEIREEDVEGDVDVEADGEEADDLLIASEPYETDLLPDSKGAHADDIIEQAVVTRNLEMSSATAEIPLTIPAEITLGKEDLAGLADESGGYAQDEAGEDDGFDHKLTVTVLRAENIP
eukprot:Selendium_serpulae@DN3987_c0_g2_i1.p1